MSFAGLRSDGLNPRDFLRHRAIHDNSILFFVLGLVAASLERKGVKSSGIARFGAQIVDANQPCQFGAPSSFEVPASHNHRCWSFRRSGSAPELEKMLIADRYLSQMVILGLVC